MRILLFLICGLCLVGCSSKKILCKGNTVYTYSTGNVGGSPTDNYQAYKVKKKKEVEITDNGSYLVIKDNPASDTSSYTPTTSGAIDVKDQAAWKRELGTKAYFAEGSNAAGRKSLWYRDDKFVLQTASIPIKIRSKITTPVYKDSFPSQVETGFNIGFLIGGKRTWNRYRTSANIFGQKTDKYSITGGLILSAGAVDLGTATTRPKIEFPRKAAMVSYGGSVVFGINSVNIGYAFGWDDPFGPNASTWLYKGKMWNGIIISLDLIK